ncbi:PAS domain-containing protein [Pedobacter sp. GR22-6]|uniref:PAS domain-containing protein n=1 Tax=Pedobacter sp. GR22-6 TaxID=3127957 RepID=UPI00307F4C61
MLRSTKGKFDYDYFIELSPDLVCVGGYDGFFKKVNAAVSKTLGYTEQELLSRPITSFVHPEDQRSTDERVGCALAAEEVVNFENRHLTKTGEAIWLSWTLVPVVRDQLIFATAQNISHRKKTELYRPRPENPWLRKFEAIVRANLWNNHLNITLLSDELGISERQLFREVKQLLGTTPNHLVRSIRLQVASEAIDTGKYRTVSEIAHFAGFKTAAYFNKLFKEVYGSDVLQVLSVGKG